MVNFEDNWRRKQEIEGRPIVDDIYRQVFGNNIEIIRFDKDENMLLDIVYAIDVQIRLSNKQIIIGQEKFLSNKYASFATVTVEHYQNPVTLEYGDWFKLACQFYFTGYFTEDKKGMNPWILLNWLNVVTATDNQEITWNKSNNMQDNAMADFKYCKMNNFPDSCVLGRNV